MTPIDLTDAQLAAIQGRVLMRLIPWRRDKFLWEALVTAAASRHPVFEAFPQRGLFNGRRRSQMYFINP